MSFFDRIKETVSDKKLDFETLFSPKKTRIVSILGMKGAGKTTLWNKLRGYDTIASEDVTDKEQIKSFNLKTNGIASVKILQTIDIPGGQDMVRDEYMDIIKESSLILFLFDIRNTRKEKEDILARINVVLKATLKNEFKNISMHLVAIHFDKFSKRKWFCFWKKKTVIDAKKIIQEELKTQELFKKLKDRIKISENSIRIGNLLDDKFVESIKDCIIKSSE